MKYCRFCGKELVEDQCDCLEFRRANAPEGGKRRLFRDPLLIPSFKVNVKSVSGFISCRRHSQKRQRTHGTSRQRCRSSKRTLCSSKDRNARGSCRARIYIESGRGGTYARPTRSFCPRSLRWNPRFHGRVKVVYNYII